MRPCSLGQTLPALGGPPCTMAEECSPTELQCSQGSTEPYGGDTSTERWGPAEGQRLLAQLPSDSQGFFERLLSPSPASSTHGSIIEEEHWEMKWIEKQRALSKRKGSAGQRKRRGSFLARVRRERHKARTIQRWKRLDSRRKEALREGRPGGAHLTTFPAPHTAGFAEM